MYSVFILPRVPIFFMLSLLPAPVFHRILTYAWPPSMTLAWRTRLGGRKGPALSSSRCNITREHFPTASVGASQHAVREKGTALSDWRWLSRAAKLPVRKWRHAAPNGIYAFTISLGNVWLLLTCMRIFPSPFLFHVKIKIPFFLQWVRSYLSRLLEYADDDYDVFIAKLCI